MPVAMASDSRPYCQLAVRPLHIELMLGSKTIKMDPEACVPLDLVPKRTCGEVRKLMCSFNGKPQKRGAGGCGMIAGSDTPISVTLDGKNMPYVSA